MGRFDLGGILESLTKKKDLKDSQPNSAKKPTDRSVFKSSLDFSRSVFQRSEPLFFPPEAFGDVLGDELQEGELGLNQSSLWDIATRYHEFKGQRLSQNLLRRLRSLSAEIILRRAQEVLGSLVHPVQSQSALLQDLPAGALHPDFDFDETLESSPLAVSAVASGGESDFGLTEQDIWMSYSIRRKQPLVLSVDTSLSMTGEKLALTAVALAVVLLEFPEDPIGIVAFENEAKVLKRPDEPISIPLLVERFLDVPAQGYTHLEAGLLEALRLVRQSAKLGLGAATPSTVLLTDGKYTAGKDPAYLASRFPHLIVLKMGQEEASLELCRELAQKGCGSLREVGNLESLPAVMVGVVRDLLRGAQS
jgi:Mg-chelatase subunit ChlD